MPPVSQHLLLQCMSDFCYRWLLLRGYRYCTPFMRAIITLTLTVHHPVHNHTTHLALITPRTCTTFTNRDTAICEVTRTSQNTLEHHRTVGGPTIPHLTIREDTALYLRFREHITNRESTRQQDTTDRVMPITRLQYTDILHCWDMAVLLTEIISEMINMCHIELTWDMDMV